MTSRPWGPFPGISRNGPLATIRSEESPKPIVTRFHAFSRAVRQLHDLRVLIGSLDCLCPLRLARVITLVLVLQHSIRNRFIILFKAFVKVNTFVTDLSSTITVLSCPFISQKTSLCPLGCKLLIAKTLMFNTLPGSMATWNSSPISGPVKNSLVGSPSTGPNSSRNTM